MSSFFTFQSEADRAEAESHGAPWPHLALAVRRHHVNGYCVRGPNESRIGRHHETARAAVAAIRRFCEAEICTATVNVYGPDAELFRVVEVTREAVQMARFHG